MSSNSTWFTRFPPSDAALAACQEVVEEWKTDMNVNLNLEETTWKMAARVNSWIGPKSVDGGVVDLVGAKVGGLALPEGALTLLAEKLTRRLLADELLGRPMVMRAMKRPEEDSLN